MEIQKFDVTRVKACNATINKSGFKQERIQLIQISDSYPVEVINCKVVTDHTITGYGTFSHEYQLNGSHASYVTLINEIRCRELNMTNSLRLGITKCFMI